MSMAPTVTRRLPRRHLLIALLVVVLLFAFAFVCVSLVRVGHTLLVNADLFEAVSRRDPVAVKRLLRQVANTEARPGGLAGGTPLMWATELSDIATMQVLLEHGANVNARENHGRTALMGATDLRAAQLLIQCGADVNNRDHDSQTALSEAQRFGRKALAQLLKKHGARE